eukprot:jgi/Mesen1/3212/ME000186S02505
MSWLLKSLAGKVGGGDEDSGDASKQEPREGGVQDDLTELRQSFAKGWKGVASFLAGDSEPSSPTGEGRSRFLVEGNAKEKQQAAAVRGYEDQSGVFVEFKGGEAETEDIADEFHGVSIDEEDAIGSGPFSLHKQDGQGEKHKEDEAVGGSSGSRGSSGTAGLQSESLLSGHDAKGQPINKAEAGGKPSTHIITGLRSDFAELSGSVASGLSKFSSVIRVVTGEDLVVKNAQQKENAQREIPGNNEDSMGAGPKGLRGKSRGIEQEALSTTEEKETAGKKPEVGGGWQGDGEDDDDGDDLPDDVFQAAREDMNAISNTMARGLSGFSKLATSLLPFQMDPRANASDGSDEEGWGGKDAEAIGVTDDVITFANDIATHPETWIDFPLPEDEELGDDFELSQKQEDHVEALEFAAPRLAALRLELTPTYMSEQRFWRIYFVLLQSKLSPEEAALLATPQVLEARALVLEALRQQEVQEPPAPLQGMPLGVPRADDYRPTQSDHLQQQQQEEEAEQHEAQEGVRHAVLEAPESGRRSSGSLEEDRHLAVGALTPLTGLGAGTDESDGKLVHVSPTIAPEAEVVSSQTSSQLEEPSQKSAAAIIAPALSLSSSSSSSAAAAAAAVAAKIEGGRVGKGMEVAGKVEEAVNEREGEEEEKEAASAAVSRAGGKESGPEVKGRGKGSSVGVKEEEEEADADGWLSEEDDEVVSPPGAAMTADVDDEDVSFSDLEEEEEDEAARPQPAARERRAAATGGGAALSGKAGPGNASAIRTSGASGEVKAAWKGKGEKGDWVQLRQHGEGDSPSSSDKTESADWLEVDEDDVPLGTTN